MRGWFLFILPIALTLSGCKVHQSLRLGQPTVEIPDHYHHQEEYGTVFVGEWWKEFEVPELNRVMDQALTQNLSLKQSWWRVAQTCWQTKVVGAARYPEITTTPTYIDFRTSSPGGGAGATGVSSGGGITGAGSSASFGGSDHFTLYLLSNALNYEVDLWRRIDSQVKAACFEWQATREDWEATAWILAGTVVDLWFTIQEQKTLLDMIDHQIDVSRTQLELIELRYSVGESSALDVYQQRLQLAQTAQERTPVETLLSTSQNQMATLLGIPPDETDYTVVNGLVELPHFPEIGSPCELLCTRPDLRAQHRRLQAADYEVASAIADRFPRLDLSIQYDFESTTFKDVLDEQISRIIGRLTTPIFDGGRRRAEVKKRKAFVCELVNGYGQLFLDALLEVEDSLVQERQQVKFLEQLAEELEIAKVNLEESRWHYINGLNDYLSVIAAIQTLQNLERRIVSEKKQLLTIRTKLYRSLGGPYVTQWMCS